MSLKRLVYSPNVGNASPNLHTRKFNNSIKLVNDQSHLRGTFKEVLKFYEPRLLKIFKKVMEDKFFPLFLPKNNSEIFSHFWFEEKSKTLLANFFEKKLKKSCQMKIKMMQKFRFFVAGLLRWHSNYFSICGPRFVCHLLWKTLRGFRLLNLQSPSAFTKYCSQLRSR